VGRLAVMAGLAVEKIPLHTPPEAWGRVILWGHNKDGPFSIIEGCHRMIAFAGTEPPRDLNITVYVGLSKSYCHWHFEDPPTWLGQGLFRVQSSIALFNDWPVVL
jgi:hypothetical protein